MDMDAETFCKTCHGCKVAGGLCHPEPLHMTKLPQGPWKDIAVDFMARYHQGTMFLQLLTTTVDM